MTEIPEHLLKRSAERRSAMGKGGEAPASEPAADAGASAPAAGDEAPAAVEKPAAAPAPLPTLEDAPPAEPPDSPVVAAAKRRKRVPIWAVPVLALLPLWGVLYVTSVKPPPAGDTDPMVIGAEVYNANCASCHQRDGSGVSSGGTGQQLSDGEVIKSFHDPLEMAYWIHYGADGGARADGTYGDLDREGGPRNISELPGAMPAFADLSPEEMAALIIYIRQQFGGPDYDPAEDANFNADLFEADPTALAALVEEVTALDPNDPDAVATVDGAETE